MLGAFCWYRKESVSEYVLSLLNSFEFSGQIDETSIMTKQEQTSAVLIGETLVHVVGVFVHSELSERLDEIGQEESNLQLSQPIAAIQLHILEQSEVLDLPFVSMMTIRLNVDPVAPRKQSPEVGRYAKEEHACFAINYCNDSKVNRSSKCDKEEHIAYSSWNFRKDQEC